MCQAVLAKAWIIIFCMTVVDYVDFQKLFAITIASSFFNFFIGVAEDWLEQNWEKKELSLTVVKNPVGKILGEQQLAGNNPAIKKT